MSSLILVKRRLFNNDSISHNVGYNTSSINKQSFMADLSACLTDFTSSSLAPPIQGDKGELHFHSLSDSSKYFLTEFSSNLLKSFFNSLSASLKFDKMFFMKHDGLASKIGSWELIIIVACQQAYYISECFQ